MKQGVTPRRKRGLPSTPSVAAAALLKSSLTVPVNDRFDDILRRKAHRDDNTCHATTQFRCGCDQRPNAE